MHLSTSLLLLMMPAALPAQTPLKGPTKLAEAACTVQFVGKIERTANVPQPGALPVTSKAVESFDVSFPGRIEEWEPTPGMMEFRFIPEPTFTEARGSFKTTQITTRSLMQQTSTTIEGAVVGGLGTWYLHAQGTDSKIIPQNIDVTMRGRVTSSTDPNLPVGHENVPVSVLIVPLILTKEQQTRMPALGFTGLSLWALQKSETPFTAKGELVFNHQGEHDSVHGNVQVTFRIDPTR